MTMRSATKTSLPVAVVGAGPVGLTTALGLAFHGIPFLLFEDEKQLSTETKAGTILSRSLEIWRRFGVASDVLRAALRVEEIADFDRASNRTTLSVRLDALRQETRYPFIINLPQHELEPILAKAVSRSGLGDLRYSHRLLRFEQSSDHVVLFFDTPDGEKRVETSFLLGCDGGRSTVRQQLGVTIEGTSLPERYVLADVDVDLDIANPRDYPYLAFFSDPKEWMVLVRQPRFWRFLFPLPPDQPEPSLSDLRERVLKYVGDVQGLELIGMNIYRVHHRVAGSWRDRRVFLLGDAAHLITPMWGLGLTTGALDASNLPWRLAWYLRGWAPDALLDGYEREQKPVALHGAAELAQSARRFMWQETAGVDAMSQDNWSNACTRSLLGVRLDVDNTGVWSLVKTETAPPVKPGDRMPDAIVHGPHGDEVRLHDLAPGLFLALYFTDVRRRPAIPGNTSAAIVHHVVSRWDAPADSGLRDRTLFDPGDQLMKRLGVEPDTIVLVRPDDHIAAIAPILEGIAIKLYRAAVGADLPAADAAQPGRLAEYA